MALSTAEYRITDPDALQGEEIFETPPLITSSKEPALEYTGERMVPEANRGQMIYSEHLTRYIFAAQLAAGKRVLDFGSGEGYGTSLLATHGAAHVSGIDISPAAIEHARKKYPQQSIDFVCADCLNAPFKDASFDLVTSFEVIEHLTDHAGYIGEVCRLLREDGILIISTPNITNSDGGNHFHLKELSLDEFIELLQAHFSHVRIFAQTDIICSMVYDARDRTNPSFIMKTMEPLPDEPESIYFVAVCSNSETGVSVRNTCIASPDGESPRLNSIIIETSQALKETSKALEEHISIIREKDKLLDSLVMEREDLLSVFAQYRDMLPYINKAQESLRHDAISVESCLALAHICLAANLVDSARWFFSQALLREPDHLEALFQMGRLYYKSGRPGLAKEYIKKVLRKDYDHPEAKRLIAVIGA